MVNNLVINGCSYMAYYADGGGHRDLAQALGFQSADSLAKNGSCNRRIIRTTLKHSFSSPPSLYVIGLTFITRYELPVLLGDDDREGKWVSFNSHGGRSDQRELDTHWQPAKARLYSEFWDKCTILGIDDLAEDLMFSVLSMIHSLESRGHRVIVFNTADHTVEHWGNKPRFDLLGSTDRIVEKLHWRSIPWQFEQGAGYPPEDEIWPAECRHVSPGDHGSLNQYLVAYLQEHSIIQ